MRFMLTALLLILFIESSGQSTGNKIKISNLTGGFYVYTTYKELNNTLFPSNSMYLVTDKGVVLFDTPWDSTQFQPLLDSIASRHNKKAVMCISTHFHDDRTAGLQYFNTKEIKTYSSKKTLDLCKKENNKQALNFFTKDTLFESGNYKFETFFAGEGHSKDNIVIWFPNEKILYGGCLIKSTESDGLGNISDANLSEWKSTIRKLIKKYPNPKYVIPGHFGWSSRKSLLHTLKLLRQY